jgi:hypothetical protein
LHANCADDIELRLLLACARWPQREADCLLIAELARGPIDWKRFLDLARHHRIVPIVARQLHSAVHGNQPEAAQDTMAELRHSARSNAMQSLRLLSELRRVLLAFREADVSARVMKGLPLAQEIFGDISLRSPGDLDLLIDSDRICEADRVLRAIGYRGLYQLERFSPRQFAYYREHWKDLAYENTELGIALDLHWRCFRNPAMAGQCLGAESESRTVIFGDLRVETLPWREEMLYLCIHGSLDGWIYLKSLVDVAAQLRPMAETDLDGLAELARAHDVEPEFSATLILVRRYFGMDSWSKRLLPESAPRVSHILRYAGHTLESRGFNASREEIPILDTFRFEWGLRSSMRYRRELVERVLYRARMWETLPLPDGLFWAYPLLSPLEWVLFRMRRAAEQSRRGDRNV